MRQSAVKYFNDSREEEVLFLVSEDECTDLCIGSSLPLYVTGDLTVGERIMVEAHLRECVHCSLELPNLRSLAVSIRARCAHETEAV
ncbi:MAG: zf-HC2 domain-containing protein [Acidobacteriia bacterium]|nr:zf-HC2 domain-containing protein [Terriglobia bacterium]